MDIIKLKNYYEHPTQRQYLVFHFYNMEMAAAFEKRLSDEGINFEKDLEDGVPPRALYGIHIRDKSKSIAINYQVIGTHRKPFIPNVFFKWFLLVFTAALIAMALIGYFKHA